MRGDAGFHHRATGPQQAVESLPAHQQDAAMDAAEAASRATFPCVLQPIVDDMRLASEEIDGSGGTTQYSVACVALALVARHFLRELDALVVAEAVPVEPARDDMRQSREFVALVGYTQHHRTCAITTCSTCGHDGCFHNKTCVAFTLTPPRPQCTCQRFVPSACSCGLSTLVAHAQELAL